MTNTTILNLVKWDLTDKYSQTDVNNNLDTIDTFADIFIQATPTVPAMAEGNIIELNNSSDKELIGLTVYGNAIQDGTPTLVENPVITISNGAEKSQTFSIPYTLNEGDYVDCGKGVVYRVETQTETPLTAEEIEAFKQLTTYYPTTTITNSVGAEMSVEYKADTKAVLKEKLDKLIMR